MPIISTMDSNSNSLKQLVHNIKVKKKWAVRIKKFISEKTFDEVYIEVIKFVNWESERYSHPSRIFIYIWEFFQIFGKEIEDDTWEWYEYRDFMMKRTVIDDGLKQFEVFELYCGEESLLKVQWKDSKFDFKDD